MYSWLPGWARKGNYSAGSIRGHGFSTQVSVGIAEGLKHESWILCDNLVRLRKVQMTRFLGTLTRSQREELDRVLKMALSLEQVGRSYPASFAANTNTSAPTMIL